MIATDALQGGREAFGRRGWADAYSLLSQADEASTLGIDDLERLATAAYLIGRDEVSTELWARAHHECLRLSDVPRAARCVFWIVLDLLTRGEVAQAGGWLARAQRLLEEGRHDCAEHGLLLVLVARGQARRGDPATALATADMAAAFGERFADPELRLFGLLARAQALSRSGEPAAAAATLDEVMVAATVDDVSPIAVGVVYCAVIEACHHIFDLARAREWTAVFSRWCSTQPDLVPFRGQCLVHRAEIMRLSGAWSKAIEEAEHACAWLTRVADQLDAPGAGDLRSFKYPVGAAFHQLAEVHRVRGDVARAEDAYRRASEYGHSPEPGLALLRLAQGRSRAAEASIRRALGQPQSRLVRANVLAACVEIMIARRDLRTARAAADELATLAVDDAPPFLRALSAQATGHILLAEGDARSALATLRIAWMGWQEIEAPFEAARARVLRGLACRALGDDDATKLELSSARRVFERLGAAPELARLNELSRAPASTTPGEGALTPRERQVIELVAAGKTNRAIARELAISERTVDRHVSNILMKLELPSRSAATAYAYEHGLVQHS